MGVNSRPWIIFSLIRVGSFALALAVLLFTGANGFVAAIAAAMISFCVSYIFQRRQRQAVSTSIARMRADKGRDSDNDFENDSLDRFDELR